MRFIVYGAGAIGGVVGARLAEHGHDVVLIARGAHYEAIRERGLRFESPEESTALEIPVVDHPSRIRPTPDDVVLLGMKTQDTHDAVRALAACGSAETRVVCMQNGVENERIALRCFADVHAMTVLCPGVFLEPGVVQAYSTPRTGIMDVGRYPYGTDEVTREIAAAFEEATFVSEPRDDIMRWKYRKLVMNLGNAIDAMCGPAARGGVAGRLAMREGEDVLVAAGIDVATRQEDTERRGDLLRLRPIGSQRRTGSSSWQSLARGTGTVEADYLNGEIVLLGRMYGVPTPVNELLQRLVNELARERRPPGSMSEEELLAVLGYEGSGS